MKTVYAYPSSVYFFHMNRRSLILASLALAASPRHAFAQTSDFQTFLRSLAGEARTAGIRPDLFNSVIESLQPDAAPASASAAQSEFTRPFWSYVESAVGGGRLSAGKAAAQRAVADFAYVERMLGVDRQVVAGIWGMESNFGAAMGNRDVLRSTASLSFRGPRRDFYRQQFIAALRILQEGHAPREQLVGSWAGAMGQTQFMPASFLKYALDADGDGRKNIWTSTRDALASAANHLKLDGWISGLPWGFEIVMPQGFDWRYGDRNERHDFALWSRLGAKRADGAAMPARGGAGLFLPTGINGPAFLITDNFEVIRNYNTSDAYALGVGHLGDRIFGGSDIRKAWPKNERQLSTDEIKRLQQALAGKGHPMGTIDGRIGKGTRKAVQAVQREFGMVPDGHPSPAVLARLGG